MISTLRPEMLDDTVQEKVRVHNCVLSNITHRKTKITENYLCTISCIQTLSSEYLAGNTQHEETFFSQSVKLMHLCARVKKGQRF